jgi:hypothetical protein
LHLLALKKLVKKTLKMTPAMPKPALPLPILNSRYINGVSKPLTPRATPSATVNANSNKYGIKSSLSLIPLLKPKLL